MRRPRFTLTDLVAAVAASAVGLTWVTIAAPGRLGPAMIVIGPLAGILWQRSQGGRGILGGMLGGAVYSSLAMVYFFSGPHGTGSPSMSTMPGWPRQLLFMTTVCLVFGTFMGLIAWLVAAVMRPWKTPGPLSLQDRASRLTK